MPDGGFQEQQWLVQRDGQFIHVTELLYRVLEQADGRRTLDEIAAGVTNATDWEVTADQARQLVRKLIPLGLIAAPAASEDSRHLPGGETFVRSPLGINMRLFVLGPRVIDPITDVLKHLYAPPVIIPLLAVIAAAHVWLYFAHGVSVSFVEVLSSPARLLAALATMILAGVFHEFGHASALRYGGGRVRGMGAGLYLIYPALYTDTTDSYRLGRWAKVRTDLGGFYFYLIFALGLMGLYFATGQEFLLFVVTMINLDIFYQCLPFVRMDGYWALGSLTGIPDLLSYVNPFLRGAADSPGARAGKLPALKPWVKAVFTAYVCLTIPALVILLLLFVTRAPWMLGVVWDTYRWRGADLRDAINAGDLIGVVLYSLQICLLAFLAIGILYMLYNLGRQAVVTIWRWSHQRPRTT